MKGDLALGKDWVKSSLRLGFTSLQSPHPARPRSFSPRFFSVKAVSGRVGAITYLCKTERNTRRVAAIGYLDLSS